MAVARMRTAGKLLEMIKENDPDTEVTLHYIRKLIKTGQLPATAVGRKRLINADAAIDYITQGKVAENLEESEREPEEGTIRVVNL